MPHFNPLVPTIPGFANPPRKRRKRRRKRRRAGAPAPRLRRAPSNRYRYVREVKGGAFQARPWLGVRAGGSLNLGLFTVAKWESREHAEWAAGRASKTFLKLYRPHQPGHGLRETIEHLKARDLIPDVLPPRVRQVEGGFQGLVRLAKSGQVVQTPVLPCPWRAYESMCASLEGLFPQGPTKSELREAARAERRARREQERRERREARERAKAELQRHRERVERERYQAGTLFDALEA